MGYNAAIADSFKDRSDKISMNKIAYLISHRLKSEKTRREVRYYMYNRKDLLILLGLIVVAALAFYYFFSVSRTAGAVAQETCPEGDGWVKVDGIDAQTFHYDAPAGKLVTDSCYKASTTLVYDTYVPPVEEVDLSSTVWNKEGCPGENGCNYQNISHASFKLIDDQVDVTPTPEVTPEVTATPSVTLTPTPTNPPTGGGSDGRSDGRSSCPECTQAPKVVVPNAPPATGRG